MSKPGGLPHLPQLDGVRAIAVMLVIVAHCRLESIVPGGFGVTIFFFLSGYLITSLLRSEGAQTGRTDIKAFYLRRTLRIWPPLYITMIFSAAVILLFLPEVPIDPWGVVAQALFAINYAFLWGVHEGIPSMPLWSLAVEEHYYLIFPFLYGLLLIRMAPTRAALWCAIACVAVLGIRIVAVMTVDWLPGIYYLSHTRIDSILFGSCLALWNNPALDEKAWRPRLWHVGVALFALLVCLAIRDEIFRQTIRYTIQGAALFVLFAWILHNRGWPARVLGSYPFRLIGLYSYTMYLCHRLFIFLAEAYLPWLPIWALIVFTTVTSMLYAALMHRFVERRMAMWRRSLHKTDKEATVTAP